MALTTLLIVLLAASVCEGVFFDVSKVQRCFYFDIPRETHIRAVYTSPETTDKKVCQKIGSLF